MTRKRFIHKATQAKYSREKALQMNRARWNADRERRDKEEPIRLQELAEINAINLPRKTGDVLGSLQWTDAATGKVRRWTVRIGERRDQVTLSNPDGRRSKSMGWTRLLNSLRGYMIGRKQ